MSADPTAARVPSRERHVRWWLGLLLLAVGLFLLGNTGERLRFAGQLAERAWPWALLGLAVLNLLLAMFRIESALAPGLIAMVGAIGLAVRYDVPGRTFFDFVLPALVAVAGVTLLRPAGTRAWTRVLLTGRVVAPSDVETRLRPRALLCELRADLRPLSATSPSREVWVTAILGHVRLTVPKDCHVELDANGTLLTSIRDPEGNPAARRETLQVRVLGLCAVLSLART